MVKFSGAPWNLSFFVCKFLKILLLRLHICSSIQFTFKYILRLVTELAADMKFQTHNIQSKNVFCFTIEPQAVYHDFLLPINDLINELNKS